ncbi:UTRA domain-containing protein [Salinispora cortesiana]|uniref:UTRA domain-containing protein n=1 Tax=Salinispora cortesiana TaxID=1305843 RepID=UPI0004718D4A|nr:UTRA domain-containing protein [Salinispora cortesiana]
MKRNAAATGYSFPPATRQEVWRQHTVPVAAVEPLNDPRIAELLKVEPGTRVLRRFLVSGPEGESPVQVSTSWIHPRAAAVPGLDSPAAGPGGWQHRLEVGGHWPITWMEIHRARMPSTREAALLEVAVSLPVLEIIRVGTSGDDGEPVEVTECVVASDRVETIHILHRDESAREPWPEVINVRAEDDPER